MLARLNSFATPTGIRCYCIVLIEEKGMDKRIPKAAEHKRLEKSCDRKSHWKRWGPYVAERAWGTVREDYSANGDAWAFVSHDAARSRRTVGTKKESPGFATVTSASASPSRCGTKRIQS